MESAGVLCCATTVAQRDARHSRAAFIVSFVLGVWGGYLLWRVVVNKTNGASTQQKVEMETETRRLQTGAEGGKRCFFCCVDNHLLVQDLYSMSPEGFFFFFVLL